MKYLTEDPKWVTFYPTISRRLYLEKAAYFDERPQINTSITQLVVLFALPLLLAQSPWFLLMIPLLFFGWGTLYIHLPIKTGIQDCDSAAWGFNYHDNTAWFYIGGGGNFDGGKKWKTVTMPWALEWIRTSTKMSDGSWFHETSKNRRSWDEDVNGNITGSNDWIKKNRWQETHPYVDSLDGTTVNATISVTEREWRPKGFMWTRIFAKTNTSIEIDFDAEVGKGKGGWKGGCVGCGYTLKPNESPLECLKRMEVERKF